MEPTTLATLVFDGECGFCTSAAAWAARGWQGSAECIPWQSLDREALADLGLTVGLASEAAWWISPEGSPERGHRAIAHALEAGRGWRRVAGRAMVVPPISYLSAAVYRLVVRHRSRLPGGTPTCRIE